MSVRCTEKKMRQEDGEVADDQRKSQEAVSQPADCETVVLPYDVVRIIFKSLLARDICNCAKVCRLWQDVAASELASRGPIARYAVWDDAFKSCFKGTHFHNTLTSKPMLGLIFNGSNAVPPDCLGRHLPRYCVTVYMNMIGLVFNNQEYERCPKSAIYAFLPDDPEVGMEFIMGDKNQVLHINRNLEVLSSEQMPHRLSVIEPMYQQAINRIKNVSCMLLITTDHFKHEEKLCGLKVIRDQIPMLWGGVSKKLIVTKRTSSAVSKSEHMLWMSILIGGPTVRSWSVVLDRNEVDREVIKGKFLDMRKKVQLKRRTLGLMFACIGRGEPMHQERNFESSIFKEVFPEVMLVGGFGNGEYGFNWNSTKSRKNGYHQYSTVFMILTYG